MNKSTRKMITLFALAVALVTAGCTAYVQFTGTAEAAAPKVHAGSYTVQVGDGKWNACAAVIRSKDNRLLNDCSKSAEFTGRFEPGAQVQVRYVQPEIIDNWAN